MLWLFSYLVHCVCSVRKRRKRDGIRFLNLLCCDWDLGQLFGCWESEEKRRKWKIVFLVSNSMERHSFFCVGWSNTLVLILNFYALCCCRENKRGEEIGLLNLMFYFHCETLPASLSPLNHCFASLCYVWMLREGKERIKWNIELIFVFLNK